MPSTTPKQHRFMAAVAHGMVPRKGGPSQAVARDFLDADESTGKFMSSDWKAKHPSKRKPFAR